MPLKKADMSIFDDDTEYLINESFCAGYDYDMMLAHVSEHRKAGDYIPEDVDERLIFDRDCTHDFNDKGYCKHCWQSKTRWLHVN